MTALVATLLVFLAAAAAFVSGNLVLGWLVRANKPSPEKGQIYECGEEPVGTAWIQFDLRFYVVALLFVIFDVELAFFFPWAVVFGSATRLADETRPEAERTAIVRTLDPVADAPPTPAAAAGFARLAFLELLAFFAVLLVGFAYLWKRGDLEWVRSVAAQPADPPATSAG